MALMNTELGGFESPLRWIKLSKYAETTGDTPSAVNKRLASGAWVRDVHARQPIGSKELWINLDAVNDWAAGNRPAHLHGKTGTSPRR